MYWLGYVVIYVATTRFSVFPVMSGTSTSGAWMFLVPVFVLGLGNGTVSEVTRPDDDFGIGSGVNVAGHAVRLDAGLARFLQVQNLFFFQNQRLPSDPASAFFVPLPQGANMTFRYQGQVLFVF